MKSIWLSGILGVLLGAAGVAYSPVKDLISNRAELARIELDVRLQEEADRDLARRIWADLRDRSDKHAAFLNLYGKDRELAARVLKEAQREAMEAYLQPKERSLFHELAERLEE